MARERLVEVVNNLSHGDGIANVALELGTRLSRWFDVTYVHQHASLQKPDVDSVQLPARRIPDHLARNADIAHSHFGSGILLSSLAKQRQRRLRHVSTHHVIPPYEFARTPAHKYLAMHALTATGLHLGVDQVVSISRYAQQDAQRLYGVDSLVIPNGVDTKRFKPNAGAGRAWRTRNRIPQNARVVGYFARFNTQKNHEMLIRLAPRLPKDTLLVLGGNDVPGPSGTRARCQALVRSLGVSDRVRLTGFVDRANQVGFYNAVDVFAHASVYESFGLQILEAMACAKPVVTLDGYAFPELVDDRNGVRAADEKEFHQAVLTLLDDEKTAKRLAANAKTFAQGYDWDVQARRYKDVLRA